MKIEVSSFQFAHDFNKSVVFVIACRDAYMKMAVTLDLVMHHPELSEGALTSVRFGVVSNENLRILARKHNFNRYLVLATPHRRKWVVGTHSVP